ncbi:hypothetical protein EU537_09830 [Candidatus Thorarchaeota archaeon]|nr:MAG: hypothetical protein EU537_09830 [Candidatus Thorarchaeota archaeon]
MERRQIAAIAAILVIAGAGTGLAALIVISNTLHYGVVVEGNPVNLTEVTGPSGSLIRGVNYTYHVNATVASGTWACYFWLNLTSAMITDETDVAAYKLYVNGTLAINYWSLGSPDTYSSYVMLGTLSPGQTMDIFWTIYFAPEMPIGDYSINVFIEGEAQ